MKRAATWAALSVLAGGGLAHARDHAVAEADAAEVALDMLTVEGRGEHATGPVLGLVARRSATATKGDTLLLETPQSVTVVGREEMDLRNVETVNEALRYTPGVATYYSNDTRNDSLTIRGFDASFFYLDGLRLPAISGRGLDQWRVDPYQLERIEVLKGPASVMYGMGEPGGVVAMVSKMPTDFTRGQTDLFLGNNRQIKAGVDLSGPVDPEKHWLYRFVSLGGFSGNQVDSVEGTRSLLAPALTYRPDAATSLTVMATYLHDDTMDSNNFLPFYGSARRTFDGRRVRISLPTSNPNYENYDKTQFSTSYHFEHLFDGDWKFQQNFRYAHLGLNNQAMFGYGLSDDQQTMKRAVMNLRSSFSVIDLDNQLSGSVHTGPIDHSLLFGLNYTHQDFTDKEGYYYRGYELNLCHPTTLFDPIARPPFNDTHARQTQDQYGLYAQDQMKIDRLVLVASGRNDWVASLIDDRLDMSRVKQNDTSFTGRVGVLYLLDGGFAPYASYATSFLPLLGRDVDHTPYKPLESTQYEAGIKFQPLSLDATFTAAAFDLRQNNSLAAASGDRIGYVQLGQTRSRGVEVEAKAQLTESLRLIGAYTVQDVEITRGGPDDQRVGRTPTATPRRLASLWGDYTITDGPFRGLGFGVGGQSVGSTFADPINTLKVKPFVLLDAAIHYTLPDWRFTLSADNMLDRTYVARCGSVTRCQYGQRAQLLLTVRHTW